MHVDGIEIKINVIFPGFFVRGRFFFYLQVFQADLKGKKNILFFILAVILKGTSRQEVLLKLIDFFFFN